jgi:hypothetical protein
MLQLALVPLDTAVHAPVLGSQLATVQSQLQRPQSQSHHHLPQQNRPLRPQLRLRSVSIRTKSLAARPSRVPTDFASPLSARLPQMAPAGCSPPPVSVIGISVSRWLTALPLRPVSFILSLHASATYTETRTLASSTPPRVVWFMLTSLNHRLPHTDHHKQGKGIFCSSWLASTDTLLLNALGLFSVSGPILRNGAKLHWNGNKTFTESCANNL